MIDDKQVREIDGTPFQVGQMQLKAQRLTLLRLTKLIGPALSELAKGFESESLLDVDQSVVFGAISRLLMTASEDDLEYLYSNFASCSQWQPPAANKMIAITDVAFRGRMMTMFKWMWLCIEVNYADLLKGLSDMSPLISPKTRTESESQSPQG